MDGIKQKAKTLQCYGKIKLTICKFVFINKVLIKWHLGDIHIQIVIGVSLVETLTKEAFALSKKIKP